MEEIINTAALNILKILNIGLQIEGGMFLVLLITALITEKIRFS